MLAKEKFPKLDDPVFYLDFAGRYARSGEHFFDMLESWCGFFGFMLPLILALFLFVAGKRVFTETGVMPSIYWVIIIICLLIEVGVYLHASKERPRWRIACSYRDICRHEIHPLEKACMYAKSAVEVQALMDNLRTFQNKFPIQDSPLATMVYNECLIARGEHPQPIGGTILARLFPGFAAFLGRKRK